MRDSFYLAWHYLRQHKLSTAILIGSVSFIIFLPLVLIVVVDDATQHFRSRAATTPLVVGSRGSPLELVLGTLYFDDPQPEIMRMLQVDRVNQLKLGTAIPLHAGVRVRETPVVGTTMDYYRLRDLYLSQGRGLEILGECMVGAKAAKRLDLNIGDKLPVSNQKAFALRDAPLRLSVVGILTPTETPDDEAIFVDLATVWIIEGFGHGHLKGAAHGSAAGAEYTDITAENADHFHFHGKRSERPITAVIIQPREAKSSALLLGEYISPDDIAQIVRPSEVMDALLAKVLMVRSYIISIVALVSLVTLAVLGLVILLSIQLRAGEIATMTRMGCSRYAIAEILGCQILIVIATATAIAGAITLLAVTYSEQLIRSLVSS